ncbi:hypothetical protein BC833DRAFT_594744 [Globomyces pollinis-pini]|nr:hypothetical protein BC833DRAFT_594744 [Globomyces pollinis-pini]
MDNTGTVYLITAISGVAFSCLNVFINSCILRTHGLHISLVNDKHRQTLLSLILLFASTCSIFSYLLNYLAVNNVVSNIFTLIVFTIVQYGLVIINHNSFARLGAAQSHLSTFRKLYAFWPILYLIPIITLIPIYLAAIETIPKGLPLNKSKFNRFYFKPLNIFLVIATELLASFIDLYLLTCVNQSQPIDEETSNSTSNQLIDFKSSLAIYKSGNIWLDYIVIWIVLLLDIFIKILIANGIPLLFDSAVTITTLALRSKFNLQYGQVLLSHLQCSNPDASKDPSGVTDMAHNWNTIDPIQSGSVQV